MPTLLYTLSGQEKRKKSYGKYIHHMLSQLKQISQDMDLFPFYGKLYDHSNGKVKNEMAWPTSAYFYSLIQY